MSFSIKDTDKGYLRIKKSMLAARGGIYVDVGIQAADGQDRRDDGQATNIMIGMVHEFGYPPKNIPSRSYLRSTFDAHKSEYVRDMNRAVARIMSSKSTVKRELTLQGELVRSDVIRKIKSGIPPPWAESTQERKEAKGKGGDTTLWDTGQLINSIRAVVR